MDVEGSPGTIITIPMKLVNVSVSKVSHLISYFMFRWLCSGGGNLPLPTWGNDYGGSCVVCGDVGGGHDCPRKAELVLKGLGSSDMREIDQMKSGYSIYMSIYFTVR